MQSLDFAQVDNDCRRLDSPTSLKTISNKHIIQANKMYCKDRWLELSAMEKKTKWQWTRNSPQAKRVKELEKEFYSQIQAVEVISLAAKERKKENVKRRIAESLEKCKSHGGPLTLHDIGRLDQLSEDEVIAEAQYLKRTSAPNIRLRMKQGHKFVKLSHDDMKRQVRDAVNPSSGEKQDVDTLLMTCLPSWIIPCE